MQAFGLVAEASPLHVQHAGARDLVALSCFARAQTVWLLSVHRSEQSAASSPAIVSHLHERRQATAHEGGSCVQAFGVVAKASPLHVQHAGAGDLVALLCFARAQTAWLLSVDRSEQSAAFSQAVVSHLHERRQATAHEGSYVAACRRYAGSRARAR